MLYPAVQTKGKHHNSREHSNAERPDSGGLQSQAIGDRIKSEIENWYCSQVFILSTSKLNPVRRLEV